MENTWETFQAAYQAAPENIKSIIDSETIPLCVRKVVDSKKLDNSHFTNLVKLYSLFVLKVIDEQSILEEMKKLGVPESGEVHDLLNDCVNNEPIIENSSIIESDKLTSDIIETEATLKTIPRIRTLDSDMNQNNGSEENTYSSTQESILRAGN